MKISIVICCYNSNKVIRETLSSIANQSLAVSSFDLIIVDNNCTDNTMQIVNDILKNTDVCYEIVHEREPGLMNARKRGVRHVANDITLFIDDDNILEDIFLENLLQLYQDKKDVGAVGVNVVPLVDKDVPKWFGSYLGVYACGKQGASSQDVTSTRMTLFGAGLSFRTLLLKKILLEKDQLFLMGRTGDVLLRGDDSELCMQCILEGWKVWYEENLVLHHNILPHRINWDYVKKARFGGGMASIVLDLYRSVNSGVNIESYSATLASSLYLFFKFIRQGGYAKRNIEGTPESFEYSYLKGRLYGLYYFGPRYLGKYKKIIQGMKK